MHLKTLLAGLSLRSATADMETEITRISYDSRTTAPGDVFVAMTGFATDGHAYIGKAVAAGAVAVVCEEVPGETPSGVQVVVRGGGSGRGRDTRVFGFVVERFFY